jgi:hypothetical protein
MTRKIVGGLLCEGKWVKWVKGLFVRSNPATVPVFYPLFLPAFESAWVEKSVKNKPFYWLFIPLPTLPTFPQYRDAPRICLLLNVSKFYPLLVSLEQKWVEKVGTVTKKLLCYDPLMNMVRQLCEANK